jgi:nucleotide-binding universal stress UspA family protein
MFERILVALDGSPASESALPAAAAIARAVPAGKAGAGRSPRCLILAHIVEEAPPRSVHGERHLSGAAEAAAYLEDRAAGLRAAGLAVETHVHVPAGEGAAAAAGKGQRGVAQRALAGVISDHAGELGFDLAVMAAHGKRGALDWLSSSLPLRAAAVGCAAVYLVKRRASSEAEARPVAILLPLDGRAEHEAALPYAAALAAGFGVPLELLAVVPRRAAEAGGSGPALSLLAPALSGASLEYAASGAADYLAALAARLEGEGVRASWSVERGRPAANILARARERKALVVLSTHRKLGVDAALDGCVAFAVATAYEGDSLIAPVPRCRD